MTLQELTAINRGKCPDCGGPITAGPRGGASINMLCYGCGSRFNILDCGLEPHQLAGTGFCERLDAMDQGTIIEMKKLYP